MKKVGAAFLVRCVSLCSSPPMRYAWASCVWIMRTETAACLCLEVHFDHVSLRRNVAYFNTCVKNSH